MKYTANNQKLMLKEPGFSHKTPMEKLEMELQLRGYSRQTAKAYVHHNQKFLFFIKKSPKNVLKSDIESYILSLLEKNKDKATINLAVSSLLFYYKNILKRNFHVKRLKQENKMHSVLSADETRQLIKAAKNIKHRLLLKLMYSTGLRVSEAVSLKKRDIDYERKIGYIRCGKGGKDRMFPLSNNLLKDLNEHLNNHTSEYLFDTKEGCYTIRTAQQICKLYSKKAGIRKNVTPHTLRRTFATHMIENNVDIYKVQKLLGHSNTSTTEGYIKYAKTNFNIETPLDFNTESEK